MSHPSCNDIQTLFSQPCLKPSIAGIFVPGEKTIQSFSFWGESDSVWGIYCAVKTTHLGEENRGTDRALGSGSEPSCFCARHLDCSHLEFLHKTELADDLGYSCQAKPSGMEPPALINRQIFLNVGHWVPPTPTSLRIDFCDCVVPLRANLFIFHGLLNRFPSVRGFPVELIYFILKPHGDKKFRRDSFRYTPNSSAFSFFCGCRANQCWLEHITSISKLTSSFLYIYSIRCMKTNCTDAHFFPMDWLHVWNSYNSTEIDTNPTRLGILQDLVQLSPPPRGLCCSSQTHFLCIPSLHYHVELEHSFYESLSPSK